jgi:cytochrome P450
MSPAPVSKVATQATAPARSRQTSRSRTAPGPRGGILGSLDLMRKPIPFLMKTFAQYGDVVHYRVLNSHVYLIAHPDGVQHVLQGNHRNYDKSSFDYQLLKRQLGEGLLTSDGPLWLRQRRLIQPVFHRNRVAALGDMMTDITLEMLEQWDAPAREGRPFDVAAEMMRLTLRIVGRALLSLEMGAQADTVARSVTTLNEAFGEFNLIDVFAPFIPTARSRRLKAAVGTLDAIVYGIIAERRRTDVDQGDLLSMLLAARDEETGEGMSDQQLRDEVLTLILAGHETTANALAWTFYLLSQNPEAECKLGAEVREVLSGRAPTSADLANLNYTRMVIDESMRIYPPAWAVSRAATEDDEIGGFRIPKGAVVTPSQFVTHRHPGFWEEPERFDPERFTPERSERRPRFAYFPFGGGPRLCIGNTFALTEAGLVLAAVAQRYRLRLMPGHPIEMQPLVTLRPRYGVRVILEPIAG